MRALTNTECTLSSRDLLSFSSLASLSQSATAAGFACTSATDGALLPAASGAHAIHTVGAAVAILLYLLAIAATPEGRRVRITTRSCVLRLPPAIHPRRLLGAVLERFVSIDLVSVDVVAVDVVAIDVVAVDVVPVDIVPIDIVPVDVVDVDVVAAHGRGAIQVRTVVVDVSAVDVAINVDVGIAVVNVNVAIHVHVDKRTVDANPAAASPAVVIDTSAVPVPIVIEPRTDR